MDRSWQLLPPTACLGRGSGGEQEGMVVLGELGSWRAGSVFIMLGTVQASPPCILARPVRGCPSPISQVTEGRQSKA